MCMVMSCGRFWRRFPARSPHAAACGCENHPFFYFSDSFLILATRLSDMRVFLELGCVMRNICSLSILLAGVLNFTGCKTEPAQIPFNPIPEEKTRSGRRQR